MTEAASATQASTPSFEDALKELEAIVRRLEAGDAPLEQAIADYERGKILRELCQDKLDEAQMKVQKIVRDAAGNLKTEPLDESS